MNYYTIDIAHRKPFNSQIFRYISVTYQEQVSKVLQLEQWHRVRCSETGAFGAGVLAGPGVPGQKRP